MKTDFERAWDVVKSVRDNEMFDVPSDDRWRREIAAAVAQARRHGYEVGYEVGYEMGWAAGGTAAIGEVTRIWGADLATTQEACEKLLENY